MEREEGAVEEAKRRCKALKNRIETLTTITTTKSSSSSSSKTTLLRLINSELSFLNKLNNESPLKLSTNIGYLESVVHILENPLITSVSRVCKPIPKLNIYVDIICSFNGKPVWFIVSDRNPRYISWQDSEKTRNNNNKGLRSRILELLVAANESCVTVRPCSIILFFSNGLQSCVLDKVIDEFGANSDVGFGFCDFDCEFVDELDEWVGVLGRSFEKACVLEIKIGSFSSSKAISDSSSDVKLQDKAEQTLAYDIDASNDVNLGDSFCALVSALMSWSSFGVEEVELVNFDTTALVAIVSGICNGGIDRILATPESELRGRFKGNYEFMIEQVNSEMKKPIHMELMPVISRKGGIVCESVCSEFQELVSMCGGPKEKSRAKHFLKHLRVVPDSPSERLMSLPTTRKQALKSKVVFGTGDLWHAPTITANMGFVRAVAQTGMSLFTVEHRPRALVGD